MLVIPIEILLTGIKQYGLLIMGGGILMIEEVFDGISRLQDGLSFWLFVYALQIYSYLLMLIKQVKKTYSEAADEEAGVHQE